MRHLPAKLSATLLAFGMACAHGAATRPEGSGLSVSTAADSGWSPWQGRVAYNNSTPVWRSGLGGFESGGFAVKQTRGMTSVNVLGDYFFAPSLAPSGGIGGLRATSGIILGTRSQLSLSQPSLPGGLFPPSDRIFGSSSNLPYGSDPGVEPAALPYLGVGYTGLSASSSWSFSADLGLVGGGASNAASRLLGTGQRYVDDPSRDVRLMPLVQVGVQYSF